MSERIEEIRRRLEAAEENRNIPGHERAPCCYWTGGPREGEEADAEFIRHALADMRWLLDLHAPASDGEEREPDEDISPVDVWRERAEWAGCEPREPFILFEVRPRGYTHWTLFCIRREGEEAASVRHDIREHFGGGDLYRETKVTLSGPIQLQTSTDRLAPPPEDKEEDRE